MYLIKVNNKRGHDLEGKSGGAYGMVLTKEREEEILQLHYNL